VTNQIPRTVGAAVIGVVALLAWPAASLGQPPANPEVSEISPAITNCNSHKPSDPITPALLTNVVPCAANLEQPFNLENLQRGFDFYSWLTFVALNWPANGGAPIGKGSRSGGDARTAWEDIGNFRQLADVMLANGEQPTWGRRIVPDACRDVDAPDKMIIHMEEETFNQPFKSGPLIDQNGNYALFDILMNKPMFDYIVANKLYSREGQRSFRRGEERFNGSDDAPSSSPGAPGNPAAGIVNFPKGSQGDQDSPGTMGAVMLKVAWKVLGKADDASKFHTVVGLIYTAAHDGKRATCLDRTLGLVGFHVGHKTSHEPQWIWTTFEHVANAPELPDIAARRDRGRRFNFYSPGSNRPLNELPPQPWDPSIEPFPNGFKSQIARVTPLTRDTRKLNASFQLLQGAGAGEGRLKGSVWENYMLISTQWPTDAMSRTDPTGAPAPTYLANTTLETYSQGTTPLSSSSCMACHNNAATRHDPAIASDFTFILEKAR
jgi:hypothetical protein